MKKIGQLYLFRLILWILFTIGIAEAGSLDFEALVFYLGVSIILLFPDKKINFN